MGMAREVRISMYWYRMALTLPLCLSAFSEPNALDLGFANPPRETAPAVFWYWVSGSISKEGISKDLEAMARVGIGEAYIGNVDVNLNHQGDVGILTEEWWEHVAFAVSEGKRTGVDIGLFNSPGWSQSGGPWIEPEEAMRYVAQSETRLTGPSEAEIYLPKPFEEFQDIAVLAFPLPDLDDDRISESVLDITSNASFSSLPDWFDDSFEETIAFPDGAAVGESVLEIELILNEERTARTLLIYPGEDRLYFEGEIQALSEDNAFVSIEKFIVDRRETLPSLGPMTTGPVCIAFPEVDSKVFRLVLKNRRADLPGGLSEIVITGAARLGHFVEKQMGRMWHTPSPAWDAYLWDKPEEIGNPSLVVSPSQIIDISERMNSDGWLDWSVPEGDWIVLRIGMTPTGVMNGPAAPVATGLEVDKMSRKYVEKHFDSFVGEAIRRITDSSIEALTKVIADSYEAGSQNWTDGIREVFLDEYKYDPVPWLPVLTGRIVGSSDQSERFLWDLRRLVANRIASEYVGGLRDISQDHGLSLWLENYGHWGYPGEFLQYGGRADEVAGELWVDRIYGGIELRAAASAAHIYGKTRVSAEMFTAGTKHWMHTPNTLRRLGDWAQTQGVNRFVMHVYIHQPNERKPGINAAFGSEFNRHNTWFEESKAWIDSLKRSHFLLQQGVSVADVAYFIGEDTPKMSGILEPALPDGYNYDFINAEVILERLAVENGVFVLPDGQRYRLIVLPPLETMRPAVLARFKELVAQGGSILGSPPKRSPSLEDYPFADAQIATMVSEMWDSGEGASIRMGNGYIFQNSDLAGALAALDVLPDLEGVSIAEVPFAHRSSEEAEIYFLSNQKETAVAASFRFRIAGLLPEVWDANSGERRVMGNYIQHCDQIEIPLQFEPGQSLFVIFRKPMPANASEGVNFPVSNLVATVDGDWRVSFDPSLGGPGEVIFEGLENWIQREEEGIKHYSGTARYAKSFTQSQIDPGLRYYLELGDVSDIARIKLNDIDLGALWTNPWRIEITDSLMLGENQLEIDVTNTWVNRIVGDASLPEIERIAWTIFPHYGRNSVLQSSGLLGPVSIQSLPKNAIVSVEESIIMEEPADLVSAHVEQYTHCFELVGNEGHRDSDPDRDGWTNLSEWFFGSDPTESNPSAELLRITKRDQGKQLSLEFNRLSNYEALKIDYRIILSDDIERPIEDWDTLETTSGRVFKNLKRNGYDKVALELNPEFERMYFRAIVNFE